jgi:ribosomal protein S18 acetylase RimI-like enzyme
VNGFDALQDVKPVHRMLTLCTRQRCKYDKEVADFGPCWESRFVKSMGNIEVLSASDLATGGWVDRILALDRENMTNTLRASGLDFPEAQRRKGLCDPSLVVIALVDDDELLGYVQFCNDWRDASDVYLSSIQIRAPYRRGMSVARLVVAAAQSLRNRSFRSIRGGVQSNNIAAISLCKRLGLSIRERVDSEVSLDISGSRTLLDSEFLARLERRARRSE